MNNTVLNTPLGDIVASVAPDVNFPGIYLSLRRENEIYSLVLLEVDNTGKENPELCAHVWNPEEPWEDPVFSMRSSKEIVDKMFEEEDE